MKQQLHDNRVFGVDAKKSVSVMEGDSVTLNTDDIQKDDQILWKLGHNNMLIARINRKNNKSKFYNGSTDGSLKDRLSLDPTGSLNITNTRTTDSGLYNIYSSKTETLLKTFNLTVYAHLPVPVINRDCSSPSSSSYCSLLCSVVNVSDVTLSWYKGNSLLSNISVSDLSISLSLPLEVEYQDKNTYSCVVAYSFTNQTEYSNITELCQPCPAPDDHSHLMVSIAVPVLLLAFIAVVASFMNQRKCKQPGNEVQTQDEEINYADPTLGARRFQSTDDVAADHTEYLIDRT